MPNRRVFLSALQSAGRVIASAEGMAGENFVTSVYQPYGFSVNRSGQGILLEINGSADNHISLPPAGDELAEPDTLLIYYGETKLTLSDDRVLIEVGGNSVTLEGGKLTTDLDIETSGDIRAQGSIIAQGAITSGAITLGSHIHTGVMTGGGVSGPPQ